jgi:hypothetical protein
MATTDRLIIIAVFADREFAQRAIDQLKLAGLTVGQMALAAHDETITARELGSEGNKDAARGGMVGALIGMGVPEDDAGHYQFEYNSARIIVVVQAGDNQQKVLHILQSSWPLEIQSHVGQAGAASPDVLVSAKASDADIRPPENVPPQENLNPTFTDDSFFAQPSETEIRDDPRFGGPHAI